MSECPIEVPGVLEIPKKDKPIAVSTTSDIEKMGQCLKDAKYLYDELNLPYELGLTRIASTLFINRR